jgi:hypothetical protein
MNTKFCCITAFVIICVFMFGLPLNAKVLEKNPRFVGPETMAEAEAQIQEFLAAGNQLKKPIPPAIQTPLDNVIVVRLDTLGHTAYDSGWNELPDHQVATAFGGSFDGIHMTFMWTLDPAAPGANRFATYNYFSRSFGIFLSSEPGFVPSSYSGSGWPRVVDGPNHEGMYVLHWSDGGVVQTRFLKDNTEGEFTFPTDIQIDPAGLWPGIDAIGNTIVVTTTDDPTRVPGRTYISTDAGATWTEIGWPGLVIPLSAEHSNAETMPFLNPVNSQQVALVNMEDSDGSSGTGASDGGVVWNVSNDLSIGTSWTTTVAYEFKTPLPDNSFYDPYGLGSSVYSLFSAAIDNNGTGHIVFNGSGIQLSATGDTLYPIHALVYWNSTDQQLIELTDTTISRNPALGDSIDTYFPGRSWGTGYPHIATGPAGQVLAVWEQPELIDSNNLRYVFGQVGGNPGLKVYATDIYAAYSPDYGQTWSSPFKLIGTDGEIERLPQLGDLEIINDSVHVHLAYLWDTNPGQNLTVGESDASICAWIYTELILDVEVGTAIGEPTTIVQSYELKQNYPNPFNPTTQITFAITKPQNVKLVVYNLLGEEISTLLNEKKLAGEHTIEFDASQLSSGLYFYTLSTPEFQETRKMVLIR